jgi:hypothetical protein
MKNLLLTFLILVGFLAQAQKENDTRIDYIKRKLTYNYYNNVQGMWWINTMTYNPENKVFRFKTISAKNPAKIVGKKYTERIFKLEDLNPYRITIEPIEESHGYLVKGEMVRIETVKHQNLVKKLINTSSATPQSYINFVIPDYLKDSSNSVVDSLKMFFEEMIFEETALLRSDEMEQNKEAIFSALLGEFEAGDSRRFAESHSDYVISFEEYKDRKRVKAGFFGFDVEAGYFYELDVFENGKLVESRFEVDESSDTLTLVGMSHPERSIVFENKSKVVYHYGDQEIVYLPARSY